MPTALPDIPASELSAVVRAVRAQPRWDRYLRASGVRAEALFAVLVAIFLHSAMSPAWISSQARFRAHQENQMLSLRQVAAVSSIALSSSALAQNAVQWRVEDGGNGNWFQLVVRSEGLTWLEARSLAQNIGGDLACLGKVGAEQFVFQLLNGAMCGGPTGQAGPYVGAFQDQSSTDYSEPTGGWRWVDGTRFPGAPFISLDNAGGQDYLHAISLNGGCGGPFRLDDVGIQSENRSYIVEWSADCNSDGIVDFGQIRSGELADTNANNIPDCCESSSSCPNPLPAREWPVASGGNGHWYQLRIDPLQPFVAFNERCMLKGGHMATITTAAEHGFVITMMNEQNWFGRIGWPAIGLSRESSTSAWTWVTGEVVSYLPWAVGEPSDAGRFAQLWGLGSSPNLTWSANGNTFVSAAVIEWSADCNSDGIVDFGQIRSGELTDTNANNIPDCCESPAGCNPCAADVDSSGSVNGVDLAAVLNTWGSSGGKYPGADVNGDGIVDGADLAEVLNGWGPCP